MSPRHPPDTLQHLVSRQTGFDYSHPGIYFVTLCARERQPLFGDLVQVEMQPSPLGQVVRREWFHAAEAVPHVQVFKSEFVLMPNHLHSLVWIVGSDGPQPALKVRPSSLHPKVFTLQGFRPGTPDRLPQPLVTFLAGFRAAVAQRLSPEQNGAAIWAPAEHAHVVHNEEDLQTLRVYIHSNPRLWPEDQLNPSAPPTPSSQEL